MIKPNMPNIPGMGSVTDALDFMKNMWSGMGMPGMNAPGMSMPGMVMPTLSVEEINKKIADLKAVESWLTLNMNMLRGTIQALEVQAATISTLQSMGDSFTASMTPTQDQAQAQTKAQARTEARPPSDGKNASSFSSDAGTTSDGRDEKSDGTPEPSRKDQTDAAELAAPLVNAAAWWNTLQNQFNQAVSSAMANEAPGATEAGAGKPTRSSAASRSAGSNAGAAKSSGKPSGSTAGTAPRKRKPSK